MPDYCEYFFARPFLGLPSGRSLIQQSFTGPYDATLVQRLAAYLPYGPAGCTSQASEVRDAIARVQAALTAQTAPAPPVVLTEVQQAAQRLALATTPIDRVLAAMELTQAVAREQRATQVSGVPLLHLNPVRARAMRAHREAVIRNLLDQANYFIAMRDLPRAYALTEQARAFGYTGPRLVIPSSIAYQLKI